jgi:hypothetical protein
MQIDFDRAVAATYATEIGAYSMSVVGTPVKKTDGTWPSGLAAAQGSSWRFADNEAYLEVADGSGGEDFEAQDFSIQCVIIPGPAVANADALIGKRNTAGGQHSWYVYFSGTPVTAIALAVSDDGSSGAGHQTTLSKTTSLATGRVSVVTVTYNYVADGSSEARIYVDGLSTASSNVFDGPPFNSTSAFRIASWGGVGAASDYSGDLLRCAYWPAVLTEADHDLSYYWWHGLMSGAMSTVTVTAAAPSSIQVAADDSGTEPYLVDNPINMTTIGSTQAGHGGVVSLDERTNLCQRSSFVTGLTGWTEDNTVGDGTADWIANATTFAHGYGSAQCDLAGTTSTSTITGACLTVAAGTEYWLEDRMRRLSGGGVVKLKLIEYSDACTTVVATTEIYSGVLAASWARYPALGSRDGLVTTDATTTNAQIQIEAVGGEAISFVADAVQLVTSNSGAVPPLGFCGCNTDAPCVCDDVLPVIGNPGLVSTVEIDATIETLYDVTDLGDASVNWYLLNLYGVAVANAWNVQLDPSVAFDSARCTFHKDGANYIYNSGGTWADNSPHEISCGYSSTGANGTAYFWKNGVTYYNQAGTGPVIRDTDGATGIAIGSQSTNGVDAMTRQLKIRRSVIMSGR